VRSLYDMNKCVISCGGQLYAGFELTAGIRQGCPLSPLLFAVTVDMLLRQLSRQTPDATIRAFADDTAMVLQDAWESVARISRWFVEFGAISGLELNLPKTVMTPLWEASTVDVQEKLQGICPAWTGLEVAGSGRYLGFVEGPAKEDNSWAKAKDQFLQRACLWGSQGLGLQYSTLTYNTFAMSVLTFLAQLESPPEEIYEVERVALRRAARGPGKTWAKPEDLWHLQSYGQFRSFSSLRTSAWAAQVRVATLEARDSGGLNAIERSQTLDTLLVHTDYSERRWRWAEWYKRSHVAILADAVKRFKAAGLSISAIKNEIAGDAQRPWAPAVRQRIKVRFQAVVARSLYDHGRPDALERIRKKLRRWKLPGPPARVAQRVLRNLCSLPTLVCPRVAAACFSTLWNRWTTERRFDRRGSPENRCLLGCSPTAEDSIEHYCRCPVVRSFADRFLQLRLTSENGLEYFMLAPFSSEEKVMLTRAAVMIYATYNTINRIRYGERCGAKTALEMLMQFGREAVRGHSASTHIVDDWTGKEAGASVAHGRKRKSSPTRTLGAKRQRSGGAVL
jgi:hypothetical protein